MDVYFPNAGWIRLDRDVLAALSQYKSARGLTSWEAAVESLLAAAASGVGGERLMNMSLSLARAVADAVLYEGYLLYPYRASSQKNQARWQFGILGPPGAAEAGSGEEPEMFADCLLGPGPEAELELHLRFLQLQARTAETADDGGGFRPVDELTVGAARWLSWDEAVEQEITLGPFPRGAAARRGRAAGAARGHPRR